MSAAAPERVRRRLRVRVRGTVQGVGFRPHAYRVARQLGLGGYVLNDAYGVLLEVEGSAAVLDEFLHRLEHEAPPLAILEGIDPQPVPVLAEVDFHIAPSPQGQDADAPVGADSATCADCLRELRDPADRRFRYPFINCTNCGPRFTIVRAVPYDRPLTTMAGFPMCPGCRREYDDPANRRFHAQPNACPECGPAVSLLDRFGRGVEPAPATDLVRRAGLALRDGLILAVKGIGGYHLACRADDERVVRRLRARKHREDKPFALMAPDVTAAEGLVELEAAARELLLSPRRPIVLAPRRAGELVARAVAPGSPELGVMLPYSPLHHLLLADAGTTLVFTSGNVSDEPIAFRDEDAIRRLGDIADLFLVHDRPIHTRTDDSVLRVVGPAGSRRPVFLRRSRGYVPESLCLPDSCAPRPLLACGAELKSTFCVAKGGRAWVSHHIGDLQNLETLRSFTEGIEHFQGLFAVAPELVAHDLHPDYLSTRYALEREGVEPIGVQHHHAHMAAVLAEHGELGRSVGAVFDGSGYGLDGTVWGGELLVGDIGGVQRVGALHPVRLPGGEQAVRQPWRMACAWLQEAAQPPGVPGALAGQVDAERWDTVARLARHGLASPATTSVGRLFDAVSALCGLRAEITYEGQAAIELEALCDRREPGAFSLPLYRTAGMLRLDARETVAAVAAALRRGDGAARVAARFHAGLADGVVRACAQLAAEHDTETVVLAGGVFANRRLLEATSAGLDARGLRVLAPQRLPAGDGGVSYGQAAVAAWSARS